MPLAYYNEHDAYAAEWLRNLIAAGHIAPGDVDQRDIRDVLPSDLDGYTQCHFFAGVGGWSFALRLAGWPDDRPVWTGSCPCQPWSVSGKRGGHADPRDLWPVWRSLIGECRPSKVFGEQVTGTPAWLGVVRSDLEALDYAVGAMPIEAACADAEHFRDRYWFVAHDDIQCSGEKRKQRGRQLGGPSIDTQDHFRASPDCNCVRSQVEISQPIDIDSELAAAARGDIRDVVDPASQRWGERWTEHEFRSRGFTAAVASVLGRQYVECAGGKWRRLPPPRVRWLGTRIPARVDKLRAFGNAIDPRPAAEFIRACS